MPPTTMRPLVRFAAKCSSAWKRWQSDSDWALSQRCLPILQFSKAGFDFGARKVACSQTVVGLGSESFVKSDSEFQQVRLIWFCIHHDKKRVLCFGELAGPLQVLHQESLRVQR